MTKHKVCTCDAYPFPHRLGGGECEADQYCEHGVKVTEERCIECDWLEYADYQHDRRNEMILERYGY